MFSLLQYLEILQLSMISISVGLGLMLGTFAGVALPAQMYDFQIRG